MVTPTHEERMRMLRAIIERREQQTRPVAKVRKPLTRAQRRTLSKAMIRSHAANALADPSVSRLKRARVEAGLSQAQLAARAHCAVNSVRRAENSSDGNVPHRYIWGRIARALNVKLEDIKP